MARDKAIQRILKIEPGIALGQWIYDRISNNSERLLALFGGLGGMSYLATITGWLAPWGPVGIGATSIVSALVVWVGLSWAQAFRAKAYERRVRAHFDEKMLAHDATINPLLPLFERKRIYLNDFALPSSPHIFGTTFIECEIIGRLI